MCLRWILFPSLHPLLVGYETINKSKFMHVVIYLTIFGAHTKICLIIQKEDYRAH